MNNKSKELTTVSVIKPAFNDNELSSEKQIYSSARCLWHASDPMQAVNY